METRVGAGSTAAEQSSAGLRVLAPKPVPQQVVISSIPAADIISKSAANGISEWVNVISSSDLAELAFFASQVQSASGTVSQSQLPSTSGDDDAAGGSGSRWWSKDLTLKLIELYRDHQILFNDSQYKKKTVWEMISKRLAKELALGDKTPYTSMQVSNRWKNLTKTYRDCIDDARKSGGVLVKCPYFDQIASVYDYSPAHVSTSSVNMCTAVSHSSVNVCAKIPIAVASSSAKSTRSRMLGYVAIAPKRPAKLTVATMTNDCFWGGTADMTPPKQMKYSDTSPSSPSEASVRDVITAVMQLNEDRKRQENIMMDTLGRMHKERMDVFRQFLDILKQYNS